MKRCAHRYIEIKTEKDRCSWGVCCRCKLKGPKKHSVTLALIAFALAMTDMNPRAR